jgi:putative tryptophan/tyrosine transport system substrate-binding protein
MKKAALSSILCAVILLAVAVMVQAQQPGKVPRIGYVGITPPSAMAARYGAFRQGLRELGYEEGKTIVVEWRTTDEKLDRLPALAAELVALKVDVIVTGGPTATRAAQGATRTVPIVMTFDPDPIGSGFIGSLSRPGGNITGLSSLAPEISGKQLELLREIVPKLTRVGILGSTQPGNMQTVREIERAAASLKVQLQYFQVQGQEDIESTFRTAKKHRADAIIGLSNAVFNTYRKELALTAIKNHLPAIYDRREFVEDGSLMSYAVSITDLDRRAAHYVDKVLRGTKPADLPVEQPTKFEFIINLKAAKQIGLIIPPNVLARADKVIR